MDTPQLGNRYVGSTFAGSRPPFTALPNWLAGRATAFEIAVLWCLQHHYPNICPSLNRIATMSGLSRRTVMGVLNTLERRGWVVREQRLTERGDNAPNHYVLTIWGEPPMEGVGQELPEGGAGAALGVGQELPPKKNNNNKNKTRTALEPPLPPGGGTDGRNDHFVDATKMVPAPSPQPAAGGTLAEDSHPQRPDPAPSPPKPTRMAKLKPFVPSPDDIPAALLPLEAPLRAFWQVKAGQTTQQAWNCLTGALERIWRHPDGGTDAVRDQLEAATQAGWRSITFANWQKYSQQPGPSSIHARPAAGPRRSATDQAADNVLAMFAARGIG
jgi:hypothetical protein